MLILYRKPGESIQIGEGIRIVVTSCDRRGVRVGIEAPANVSILREEIVTAIAEENRRAGRDLGQWLDLVAIPAKTV